MLITETKHLRLRHFDMSDAEFILDLYNQPSFIQHIGERGIHSLKDAENFIEQVHTHYCNHGFWLYIVELKENETPIGVNGLIQRNYLDAPDIGFALNPTFWGKGYAKESTIAVIQHATTLGLPYLYAVTNPDNHISKALLTSVGFTFIREEYIEDAIDPTSVFMLKL